MSEATQKDWWADDDGCIAAGHGEEYETLAKVLPGPHKDLMIAAPDLLAELRQVRMMLENGDLPEIKDIIRVIEKAEGK